MVSFNCDACNDVVKKPKLDQHHHQRCGASFTCLDCSLTFYTPAEWKGHTTCVSEAQKYERTVYRGEKGKGKAKQQQPAATAAAAAMTEPNESQSQSQSQPEPRKRKEQNDEKAVNGSGDTAKQQPSKSKDKDKKSKKQKRDNGEGGATKGGDDTALQSRLAKLATPSGTSLPLSEAIEQLSKKESVEEKKMRKQVLKALKVDSTGQVTWS